MDQLWLDIADFVHRTTGITPDALASIIWRIVWTIVTFALYLVLTGVLKRAINRRTLDAAKSYQARKALHYILGLLLVVMLAAIWLSQGVNLATYLGLISAGLIIALQNPIANLVAWLILVTRRTFSVGDRIQIADNAGDVIDINLLSFSMLEISKWPDGEQSTGRIVHVPNSRIFTDPIANYTQGFDFVWNEIQVLVTFASNWVKAKTILQALADKHSAISSEDAAAQVQEAARRFMIHYEFLTPIVWTAITPAGIALTLRYPCQPRQRRSSTSRIWEEVLNEFANCPDVELAYGSVQAPARPPDARPPATRSGLADLPINP